ncbi:conserved protein of unknown function [Ruminococcaceae bacterium BL-6]|nr:conserved protein of unknown function [Ruminococcaceae bacterium BL-6]
MTWIDAAEEAMQELSTDLGIPYDYQRNRSPVDQLPDSYMVYFLVDDPVESVFDGRAQTHQPRVQASFFFRDPRKMLTVPDQITEEFQKVGFGVGDAGPIPYQPDTGHYGWRRDFYCYENFRKE